MTDFLAFSFSDVAAFAETHCEEMGAHGTDRANVLAALEAGTSVLETRSYGFAIIQQTAVAAGGSIPHLWLLFIDPSCRGRKLGHKFMRELLRAYSKDFHMSVYCYGPDRRRFFGRLGFVVEHREGDCRRMTTDRQFR